MPKNRILFILKRKEDYNAVVDAGGQGSVTRTNRQILPAGSTSAWRGWWLNWRVGS